MFAEKNRGRRAANEAKAIERKAKRNGRVVSGREASRLTQVKGRAVRFSFEDNENDDQYAGVGDW